MNIKETKEKLKYAFENKQVLVLEKAFSEVPNWENFVDMIEHVDSTNHNSTNTRGDKFGIHASMYIRIADVFDPVTNRSAGDKIPEFDAVLDFCNNLFEKETTYAEAYINLKTQTEVAVAHNDPWTAVAWTCIGEVEWRIYRDQESKSDFYRIFTNPGDLIIIPQGVMHSVHPVTPRASISLAY